MTKFVYDFSEGNKDMKDLLGGKGANLAEMTKMGLPVPPGFTITTEACLNFLASGGAPPEMLQEAGEHLVGLQEAMGKSLGDPDDPLLVSVRSGAKFSMPGMMDTVLNLGLNDESVKGLAKQTGGDMRFANDAYRRFIQMFGKIVMDVPADAFEHALDEAKERKGAGTQDTDLDADDLADADRAVPGDLPGAHGRATSPRTRRTSCGWRSTRSSRRGTAGAPIDYRRQNKISDDLGTAVNVQAMVFGNRGDDSGTGVAFTRDPSTGEKVPYGDYLPERAGRGRGGRHPQHASARRAREPGPAVVRRAPRGDGHARGPLPRHVRHRVHDREAHGSGCCRRAIGKRTAFAEWVMAYDMLEEGLDRRRRRRCSASTRTDWRSSSSGASTTRRARSRGSSRSRSGSTRHPEPRSGRSCSAPTRRRSGRSAESAVILVRRETTPDDYHGMIASQGILTSAGGTNSHAAVVARGEGIPAVCGADAIKLDFAAKTFSANGTVSRRARSSRSTGSPARCRRARRRSRSPVLEKARAGDADAREEKIWKAFER